MIKFFSMLMLNGEPDRAPPQIIVLKRVLSLQPMNRESYR